MNIRNQYNPQIGWVGNISFGVTLHGCLDAGHKWLELRFGHRIFVVKLW